MVYSSILEYFILDAETKTNCQSPHLIQKEEVGKVDPNMSDFGIVELTCRQCPFECETKDEINTHMKTAHNPKDVRKPDSCVFKCHLCDYGANDTKKIDAHGLIEHGVLACEMCDYRAEDRNIMRKHMETHTGRSILFTL